MSAAQVEQLRAAVCEPFWTKEGVRLEFDTDATAAHGYGVAIRRNRRLYGVMRPSPASLHHLPPTAPVFVRTASEARQLTDTSLIAAERITHFDLPEFEQLSLM